LHDHAARISRRPAAGAAVKAALHRAFGGLEVLEVTDVPDPVPGSGDVLVAVRATALNRLDVLQREGPALLPGFTLPHIAGMDVAGEVVAVGAGVAGVGVGDRVVVNPALHCGVCDACTTGDDGFCPNVAVVGGNHPGGYAELVVVPATHVYPIPDAMGFAHAAALPTVYSTAWHALVTTAKLQIGEWVMIHAAGSGVSVAGIQLAKRMGAKVIATAGSAAKLDLATRLGADAVVDNRTGDVIGAAKAATGGRGVDVVFDHVGPALFQVSLLAMRPRGRLVFCGTTTGDEATFNLPFAYHFGMQLLGADPYSYAEFERMLAYTLAAGFDPVIDSTYPLAEVAEAQRRMEAGDVLGKVILLP
jgi:NADPH:quinone reductase-like Zn-dependent oxidoreductase